MATATLRIYEALAEDIINGTILPGHKLEEQALAEQFGVSRTPVREVLRDLAAKRLVEFVPRRGAVVAQLGLAEMTDLLEAECELEALCAKLSAHKMSALEKVRLQDIHERAYPLMTSSDHVRYLKLNAMFHAAICAGVHNMTLNLAISQLRDRLAPFRRSKQEDLRERLRRSHDEHDAIVKAIMNGEANVAYQAMRLHNARLSAGAIESLQERAVTPGLVSSDKKPVRLRRRAS